MAMTFADIRLGTPVTLHGLVTTMDATNGGPDDNFEMLPDGEALITLHVRLEDQVADITDEMMRDALSIHALTPGDDTDKMRAVLHAVLFPRG